MCVCEGVSLCVWVGVRESMCECAHACEHMWVVCSCVCSYICMCEREGEREHRRGRRRERKREMEDQFFHVSCPGTGRKTMAGHQGHMCLWFSPVFCFVSLLIYDWWPLSHCFISEAGLKLCLVLHVTFHSWYGKYTLWFLTSGVPSPNRPLSILSLTCWNVVC